MTIKFDEIIVIDISNRVLCDSCSLDLTEDKRSGGFLFGSYAYGPCCSDERLKVIKKYNEERFIKAFCPPNMIFSNWVISIRKSNL